jgi:alkanesulfonate monooxygenase SsuD/methylene tetrahydromethanopterin reductase-like flavin-dependent oxidoreductase (luciferase family)
MVRRTVPPEEVVDHVRALDRRFDELWVVEDLPYAGGVGQLATVLSATRHAKVGHGIAPAPFRNPVALAMEWAAIARMHPGRLLAGIGHGVPAWMRSIGGGVASPLALLEEQVVAIRALLAGDTVSVEGRYVRIHDVRLEYPPSPPIPVLAGVRGPKSLRLSGRVADGTVLGEGLDPTSVADARTVIREGATDASAPRHQLSHRLVVFCRLDTTGQGRPDGWSLDVSSRGALDAGLDAMARAGADSVVFVPTTPEPADELLAAVELTS